MYAHEPAIRWENKDQLYQLIDSDRYLRKDFLEWVLGLSWLLQLNWREDPSHNPVIPDPGSLDVLRLQLPEAFTSTGKVCWEFLTMNAWGPKVRNHCPSPFSWEHQLWGKTRTVLFFWNYCFYSDRETKLLHETGTKPFFLKLSIISPLNHRELQEHEMNHISTMKMQQKAHITEGWWEWARADTGKRWLSSCFQCTAPIAHDHWLLALAAGIWPKVSEMTNVPHLWSTLGFPS